MINHNSPLPKLSHLFPPTTFSPNRLVYNELGSFDKGSFEKHDIQNIVQNEVTEESDDSQDLESKYADAVRKLELELDIEGLSDNETTLTLKYIRQQEDFISEVEGLIDAQQALPLNFKVIDLTHVQKNPFVVESILIKAGKDWNDLTHSLTSNASHDEYLVTVGVELAIQNVLLERISKISSAELSASELDEFISELKQHSELKHLYIKNREKQAFLTHEELDAFAEKYTPILLDAYRQKNDAYAKLPSLVTENEEDSKALANFLSKYPPNEESSEKAPVIPTWGTLLENIQAEIEQENDPVKKREKFDRFLNDSKEQFGPDIEAIILEAIESNKNFKQLAYLIATTSTKEQASAFESAIANGTVSELYYKSVSEEPSYFYQAAEEKIEETRVQNIKGDVAKPSAEPKIIPTEEFIQTLEDKSELQQLANCLTPNTSEITENENGSFTIQQDESTQITLPSDYLSTQNPVAKVIVGQEPFTEQSEGKLAEIDKIVEQANSILFVRYGLDAEEFIPGGLHSHTGRELALKLAGLFFFHQDNDQKSEEQDSEYESLTTKTEKAGFKDNLNEFFGIEVSLDQGISRDSSKEQLGNFLTAHDLLTKTGVLKPFDDIAWKNVQQKKENYLIGSNL